MFREIRENLISFFQNKFDLDRIVGETGIGRLIQSRAKDDQIVREINQLEWVRSAEMKLKRRDFHARVTVNALALRLFYSLPPDSPRLNSVRPPYAEEINARRQFEFAQDELASLPDEIPIPATALRAAQIDYIERMLVHKVLERTDTGSPGPVRPAYPQKSESEERNRNSVANRIPPSDLEETKPDFRKIRGRMRATLDTSHGDWTPVETDALTAKDVTRHLWFGTNRKPVDASDISKGFTGERDTDRVHLGICKVLIPEAHQIGSIGSPWWKRWLTRTDDRLKITALKEYAADDFWRSVSKHLQKLALDEREAVIFVHGYNVSFENAALRAAQIGADLSIRGCMAFYSWPSRGSTEKYMDDEASIEASESQITQFLADFARKSGAAKLHLIAHSMGNRGVLRAVNRMAAEASHQAGKPFDQIILAAPDVDAGVFKDLCKAYAKVSRRTTLYVSAKDRAVEAAQWLHGFPRAGLLPPIMLVPDIDTVNVTHADLTMLGHGYVAQARIVLNDMHSLLRFGAHPKDRAGLKKETSEDGQTYWLISK